MSSNNMAVDSFAVDELRSALQIHLKFGPISSAKALVKLGDTVDEKQQAPNETKGGKAKNKNNNKDTAKQTSETAEQQEEETKKKDAYDRWTLLDEASLDYGYFCGALRQGQPVVIAADASPVAAAVEGDTLAPQHDPYYYITTAINYTNGPAHMGHAYEATTSDAMARYRRLSGQHPGGVYFVTGTDEHGQKIANTAADRNAAPIEICDLYSTGFRVLNQRLLISNDDYIRTTSPRHKRTAQALWMKCKDDIYLDTYTGWYNVKEETFVTDSDAQLWEYKDPTTGIPLKKVDEESYFFKMSKYQQQLIQYISVDNPTFIQPEMHKNSILQRLQTDELRDLSISRTTFDWGVPVPEGFHSNHVMYVWVDALSNYLTGVDALGANDDGSPENLSKFWPANNHVIGKDILWFHTVIWPTLLMSANIPLPKTVFAHGFVNDKDGKKMSKSLGNVVDPHDMLDQFDVDSFRWYLCKEAPNGGELSFSQDSMQDMHNADLCDNIGNCVNRATTLCGRFCVDGLVPDVPPPERPPIADWSTVLQNYQAKMNAYELQAGCQIAVKGFSDINGWLQEEAPWAKKGDEHAELRQVIVRGALEAIYALAHLLLPFMPVSGKKIFQMVGTEPVVLSELKDNAMRNLKAGTKIDTTGQVLYEKLLSEEEKKASAAKKKDDYEESRRKKQEAKRAQAAAASAANNVDPNQSDFTKLDIRVGQIVKVWHHETADKLFCEQINVGNKEEGSDEVKLREIASGLREHYTLEEMQDKKVLVLCNLKPQKMLGFESNGMVLAASITIPDESGGGGGGKKVVELVAPPEGAQIGERVVIAGLGDEGEPWTAAQVKKRKVLEAVMAAGWKINDEGIATWNGMTMQTTAGPCRVSLTLANGTIA
ncbi:hypothetical protein ACA910_002265 [Epithemia clementina (nom. ined.)]